MRQKESRAGAAGRHVLFASTLGALAIASLSTTWSFRSFVGNGGALRSSRDVSSRAYGDLAGRKEWLTYPKWRGERTWQVVPEAQADSNRAWYVFDAEGKSLGKIANVISAHLRGKLSPLYTTRSDVGAYVIVVNCDKIRVPGFKYSSKLYFRNNVDRPGSMKAERFKDIFKRFPERIMMSAVWGMMPKTKSGKRIFKERLKLYSGPNHAYHHMNPIEYPMWKIKTIGPESDVRRSDRLDFMMTKGRERLNAKAEMQEKRSAESKLSRFKDILRRQIQEIGKDAEKMGLSELTERAQSADVIAKLNAYGDKPIPKNPVKTYLGTRIPRVKIVNFKKRFPSSKTPPL